MTYISDSISRRDKAAAAAQTAQTPQADFVFESGASPRFLVNIIDKRELVLLEELLSNNKLPYIVRNASHKNRRAASGFSMLGKDVYVETNSYSRAKALLADYYLGGEQATADTNAVPAARRQQTQRLHAKRYPVKSLIMWLVLATVGYTMLFAVWMHLMK